MSIEDDYIKIGKDLHVMRVGFGAMKLTGDQVWGPYPDHDRALAVLRGAVDAGVQLIDTADVYGPHTDELLIREALFPYPSDLVIATKGGFVRGGFEYDTLSAVGNVNYLRQSAHMSVQRLGSKQSTSTTCTAGPRRTRRSRIRSARSQTSERRG
jgi:aryl-alcohol dehydrogenase-like predicted oxidoreductase